MSQTTENPRVFVADGVVMGRQVSLGPFCAVLANDDPGGVPTRIADDVTIGANATICGGCSVGQGALVLAGAVVNQDVPEHAIVSGNPAVVIGYRNAPELSTTTSILDTGVGAAKEGQRELGVGGCYVKPLPCFADMRGSLTALEDGKGLPFVPARVFLVYGVKSNRIRGEHAHRQCQQFLVAVSGSVSVVVDDGRSRAEVCLDTPTVGLYLPPMVWGIQYKFDPDSVLMVLASRPYEAHDYIRDYGVFLEAINKAE